MRILIFSYEYPPNLVGGLGRHVAELAPALAEQHMVVHVVTPASKQEMTPISIEHGVTVHRVFTPALEIANIYDQVLAVNKDLEAYALQLKEPFDLIHVHDWLTGFVGIALQKAWERPLLATIHATERGRGHGYIRGDLEKAIDGVDQQLIELADHVIVCSRYMLQEVQSYFHTSASQMDVVFNGVNTRELRNGHHQNELLSQRERCPHQNEQIVFAVARLVHEKGMHRLVEAAPRILAEFPRTRIIIAGKGPEARTLKQCAEQLGVADQVDFVGFVSDEERNQYYQHACCAVFPSLYEPFGIVALEAMALGCPVVVSEVGGLAEIVHHENNGVTVYPNNADSIAWGVTHILSNPQRAQQYAREAFANVEELYSWARIARLTHGVYRRVVERAGRDRAIILDTAVLG
jgi:glycosyltransferase involved in cell wall biosynthesis